MNKSNRSLGLLALAFFCIFITVACSTGPGIPTTIDTNISQSGKNMGSKAPEKVESTSTNSDSKRAESTQNLVRDKSDKEKADIERIQEDRAFREKNGLK